MITLTETAANHIQTFLTKRGKGEGIRLGVKTSGCSGMAYTLEFVDEVQPEDMVFEGHGVRVLSIRKAILTSMAPNWTTPKKVYRKALNSKTRM